MPIVCTTGTTKKFKPYDKDGNVLTKKYSDSQTFNNEYDEKGRISSSSYGETTVNYAYDTHGQ